MEKEIVEWIVEQATENTSTCNWIVEFRKIEERFKISLNNDLINSILDGLLDNEKVSYAEIDLDSFDINLYGDYCKNLDDETKKYLYEEEE